MTLWGPESVEEPSLIAAESTNLRLDHPCANTPRTATFRATNSKMLSTTLIIVMCLSSWSFVIGSPRHGGCARLCFYR